MNINRKSENSIRFCCPKGLEKNMNFFPKRLITLKISDINTFKFPLLKKTKRIECMFWSTSLLTE